MSTATSQKAPIISPEYVEENGRIYSVSSIGLSWMPCDEYENTRLDMVHSMLYNSDKLALPYYSSELQPQTNQPVQILDIGCGNGHWAFDVADSQRSDMICVTGVDVINMTPPQIPVNATFEVNWDFNREDWPLPKDHFDLVHLSMITACKVLWPNMYSQIFKKLRPGVGFIEQLDFDIRPETIGPKGGSDSSISQWYTRLEEAARKAQHPIHYDPNKTQKYLETAGFVDIERKCIELPWNHYKRPGENYQIGGLMNIGFLDAGGLQSYCMAYFTRICGMTQEQVERMCGMIRREINSPGIAVFSHLYLWKARKPFPGEVLGGKVQQPMKDDSRI